MVCGRGAVMTSWSDSVCLLFFVSLVWPIVIFILDGGIV
jgi:hypothetical protein